MADYIKFKWLRCATCLLTVITAIQCLLAGENCLAENQEGVCKPIRDCPSVLDEVRRSSSPVPVHLKIRLNALLCGFENDGPIVCCASVINFNNQTAVSETRQPTPQRNIKGKNSTVSKGPPDVSKHRNINLLPTSCGFAENDRILGGDWTRQFGMPWLALLAYNSSIGTRFYCGGSIISEWYVLTAAHCVSFLGKRRKLAHIILGEYDISTDPDCEDVGGDIVCAPSVLKISISEVIAHPGYNPQSSYDDIALLRLAQKLDLSSEVLKPICLPITRDIQLEKLEGKWGKVAGWGTTVDGQQTAKLLSVTIPLLKNEECENAYRTNISERQVCAGGAEGVDSCASDSGGPLMYTGELDVGYRKVQRGIASFKPKLCGLGDSPGVYTNVAYYMDWILDNMHE